MKVALTTAAMAVALAGAGSVHAQEIVRHGAGSFPISSAVEVPAGKTVVYLSGSVPSVIHPDAPKGSLEAYGDTKAQTINVLGNIQQQLKELGLGLADVVKMQVFLVGGPENGGKMDFDGFMAGYTQFFGPAATQPVLPARSAFQIAGLADPAWRVEIEVTAVRP
ncbi:Enamine deaminase RidA, house cleaning of reactive enamine intermediates, YjgF/YER057c/UK114 family [Pseudomonas sp. URIL14HWK12:I8]|uniref:RidA family protein n=1 Tax=unclassified Pseudomonas TaxID=196821 RepID=UPI000417CDB9|nr:MULTISPECIES: RidA family protein [unclassified Pseudomonas]SNB83008.1 Enamine deaminase RidA, house cleaning of reactive enamine intermediates, YjgF/YER057c/UK114 family [Pseudomonas sp. URIL14HWK12:I8]